LSKRYKRFNRKSKIENLGGLAILALILIVVSRLVKNDDQAITENSYVTTTGLNIRKGIGKRYPISFTLEKGDKVDVITKNGVWYKIKYNNQIGYANSKYLEKYVDSSNKIEQPIVGTIKRGLAFIGVVILLIALIYYSFILYIKFRNTKLLKTVTDLNRGTASERDLVLRILKYGIANENIFHDLYLKNNDNNFSQIDLAIVTEVGLIVFEVKDYSGWIYGTGNQPQWTKVLAYGKQKYHFQNPIIQNDKHILCLQEKLKTDKGIPFFSIIVFYGSCVLRNINFIPQQKFVTSSSRILDALQKILNDNPNYQYRNKDEVISILHEAKINGGVIENQKQHIANVRDMLGTDRIFD